MKTKGRCTQKRNIASEEVRIREAVRRQYAELARKAAEGQPASCCGPATAQGTDSCGTRGAASISSDLYSLAEISDLPDGAALASLGSGNPIAVAELQAGETVLDLGSGGGIDVLLAARRVGPTGIAYGVDMTDEMLDLARRNQQEAGIMNAEFLKGTIEEVPLPDSSVDVVISNCVINLSTDKDRVLSEAFRILRPGGRLAVSDVVFQGEIPEGIRGNVEHWSGCVAGALHEEEYRAMLAAAGFTGIEVEFTRVYGDEKTERTAADSAAGGGGLASAFIRARKPA